MGSSRGLLPQVSGRIGGDRRRWGDPGWYPPWGVKERQRVAPAAIGLTRIPDLVSPVKRSRLGRTATGPADCRERERFYSEPITSLLYAFHLLHSCECENRVPSVWRP